MTYDPTGHLLLTPNDKEAPARVRRLRELGLGERPEPAFDDFAHRLAEMTGAPFSMVNFIDENRQFFAGLHTPRAPTPAATWAPPRQRGRRRPLHGP